MFISGGENVYPAEVEGVLAAHAGIAEVAVLGRPDARWGEVGLAVVVPRRPGALSAQEVLASCDGRLARYKIPKAGVSTTTLPRNAVGKVIKAELYTRYIAPLEAVEVVEVVDTRRTGDQHGRFCYRLLPPRSPAA